MAAPIRVLVAETAPRYREELVSLLRSDGFEAHPVESPNALRTLEWEPFRLAIVGLRQTHVDPLILVRRAVELGVPCIMTAAGFYDREAREVCLEGADSVWMYPLDGERFLARVRAVIEPAAAAPAILLVDDNDDTRRAFRRTLEKAGYAVVEADRGVEAVRLALTRRFDAVVLDLNMPGLDGFAVCQILKTEPATTRLPILVCTVRSGSDDQLRVVAAGADGFLAKPFRPDELVERIRILVEISRESRRVSGETSRSGTRPPDAGP